MARSLTPRDAHALINLIYKEATGMDASIQAVDTSTFVSVGEKILATGVENTLNAISIVIGRTFMAVRPYSSKFGLIEETDTALYKNRVRKISFYSRYALASGDWNTQLYTNLANDFDNGENPSGGTPQSTKSMWVQNQAIPLELNFAGSSVWQDSTTVYRDQLKVAFTDEATFNSFVAGILTEKGNDIELQRESFRRMTLLNQLGGAYSLKTSYPTMAINLTTAYNTKFGTNYTSNDLRTTYLKSFLEFMVATVKQISRRMEYRTTSFHIPYTKTIDGVEYNVLRHTPKDRQRFFLYSPLMIDAEAQVMPEIFGPDYLKMDNYELVDYWQNFNDPAKVVVTPAIPDTANGVQTAGDQVTIPYVVGCIFDRDAILVNNYLEDSLATPVEARKRYYNIWWTFCRNAINDFTENFVLLYMEDGETPPGLMSVTPNPVTITVDENGDGIATLTFTGLPEGTADVSIVNDMSGLLGTTPLIDNTAEIVVTGATSSETINNIMIALDENNGLLSSCNIVVNIVVPEG